MQTVVSLEFYPFLNFSYTHEFLQQQKNVLYVYTNYIKDPFIRVLNLFFMHSKFFKTICSMNGSDPVQGHQLFIDFKIYIHCLSWKFILKGTHTHTHDRRLITGTCLIEFALFCDKTFFLSQLYVLKRFTVW